MRLFLAKGDRQLYTLNPAAATPSTSTSSGAIASKPPLEVTQARVSGPIRSQRQTATARMRTGPMSAALKARVLGCISNKMSKAKEASACMSITPPTEAECTKLAEPARSNLTDHTLDDEPTPPPPSPVDTTDSTPHTPAFLDLPDTEMDGSPPPETDMMSVDEEVLIETVTTSAPCDLIIKVNVTPSLGVSSLVQASLPALLFVDEDERPDWLSTSIKDFLRHMPYYLCLGKVVDLFLSQESRLGYPVKVKYPLSLYFHLLISKTAVQASRSAMRKPASRGCRLHEIWPGLHAWGLR